MAFSVPEAALNVTLQEDKYRRYVQELGFVLRRYDEIIASLSPLEKQLLKRQLGDIQQTLGTGFTPLNWNSQRIMSFIDTCDKKMNELIYW